MRSLVLIGLCTVLGCATAEDALRSSCDAANKQLNVSYSTASEWYHAKLSQVPLAHNPIDLNAARQSLLDATAIFADVLRALDELRNIAAGVCSAVDAIAAGKRSDAKALSGHVMEIKARAASTMNLLNSKKQAVFRP